MSTTFFTLAAAFVVIVLCAALLGISLLFTGKSRLRIGMCGRVPTKKKNDKEGCGTKYTCGLCSKGERIDEEK